MNKGAPTALPECDWVYFATTAKFDRRYPDEFRAFVEVRNVIVRSLYNSKHERIANVGRLKPGQRILLVHNWMGFYRPLLECTIDLAAPSVRAPGFEVCCVIPKCFDEQLTNAGFERDPGLGFTGIALSATRDLRALAERVPWRFGNTIRSWKEVFGP